MRFSDLGVNRKVIDNGLFYLNMLFQLNRDKITQENGLKPSKMDKNGLNDFNLENPGLSVYLLLAGPMTVIPLFLYVRGVEYCGLGPTGMIFYITPTLQFLLGYFLYNEPLNIEKLISFIFIWIAVFIYLKDLYENK